MALAQRLGCRGWRRYVARRPAPSPLLSRVSCHHGHPRLLCTAPDEGRLSERFQDEGGLWHRLWETARPVPAEKQKPLFDAMGAAERAIRKLEEMTLADLALQLMPCLLHAAYHALAGRGVRRGGGRRSAALSFGLGRVHFFYWTFPPTARRACHKAVGDCNPRQGPVACWQRPGPQPCQRRRPL